MIKNLELMLNLMKFPYIISIGTKETKGKTTLL